MHVRGLCRSRVAEQSSRILGRERVSDRGVLVHMLGAGGQQAHRGRAAGRAWPSSARVTWAWRTPGPARTAPRAAPPAPICAAATAPGTLQQHETERPRSARRRVQSAPAQHMLTHPAPAKSCKSCKDGASKCMTGTTALCLVFHHQLQGLVVSCRLQASKPLALRHNAYLPQGGFVEQCLSPRRHTTSDRPSRRQWAGQ